MLHLSISSPVLLLVLPPIYSGTYPKMAMKKFEIIREFKEEVGF